MLFTHLVFSSLQFILCFGTDLTKILPWSDLKKKKKFILSYKTEGPAAPFPLCLWIFSSQWSLLLLSRICCFSNPSCLLCSGDFFFPLLFLHPRILCFHPSYKILLPVRLRPPGWRVRLLGVTLPTSKPLTPFQPFLCLPSKHSDMLCDSCFDMQILAYPLLSSSLSYKSVEAQSCVFCIYISATMPENGLALVTHCSVPFAEWMNEVYWFCLLSLWLVRFSPASFNNCSPRTCYSGRWLHHWAKQRSLLEDTSILASS